MTNSELFHPVLELPEPVRQARYQRLVGLDDIKSRLRTEAAALADPAGLTRWASRHHPHVDPTRGALTLIADRAPLLVFAGDVGCGKSALAESFGCDLAERLSVPVMLYRLNLTARGTGHVGEMTTLIGEAFGTVGAEARLGRAKNGALKSVTVLVVDEADALVQSREQAQMHHEDRAGVNAFLAGVDEFAGTDVPLLVVLCTNRLTALDPALQRRAAAIFEFGRPSSEQRRAVLADAVEGFDIPADGLEILVETTGPRSDGQPGFTFSDLTQRLIPTAVLTAYPDRPLTIDVLIEAAAAMTATPVFGEGLTR